MSEEQFKARAQGYREGSSRLQMPSAESVYDKKQLFKLHGHLMRVPLPEGTSKSTSTSKSNAKKQ
jgi:hypothetical protein